MWVGMDVWMQRTTQGHYNEVGKVIARTRGEQGHTRRSVAGGAVLAVEVKVGQAPKVGRDGKKNKLFDPQITMPLLALGTNCV